MPLLGHGSPKTENGVARSLTVWVAAERVPREVVGKEIGRDRALPASGPFFQERSQGPRRGWPTFHGVSEGAICALDDADGPADVVHHNQYAGRAGDKQLMAP